MSVPWKEYQEKAADFFRSLGLEAETDVRIKGVRTSHDIDVVARSRHVGFDVTWLIECKLWKSPVSKLHVLGLREIVREVGADRGIILSEAGFQIGAHEAARLTNVQLSSLHELELSSEEDIFAMRLRNLFDQVEKLPRCIGAFQRKKELVRNFEPTPEKSAIHVLEQSSSQRSFFCRPLEASIRLPYLPI